MDPQLALAVIAVVLLGAAAIGLWTRRRDGRVRAPAPRAAAVTPEQLGLRPGGAPFGERATLVQFSTEYCARCPAARRVLGSAASERDGVAHVDVDLTHRPDVARRFEVRQTPTTLVVDARGVTRARIVGAPQPADVARELDRILEDAHA